jgi:o-succinylbenzoate synthase
VKLAAVSIAPLAVRLEEPVANSRAQWSRREGALVQLLSDDGAMGQGEASPLPNYSPDSLSDVHDALVAYPWQGVDDFLRAPDLASLNRALEPLPAELPAARFAVESALLDLLSERCEPWELLGLRGPPGGGPIPRAQLLGQGTNAERVAEGASALRSGVEVLKVKLGLADFSEELSGLRVLRVELGDDFGLRLDVNQGWSEAEVVERLAALSPLHVELVEEPIPWRSLAALGSSSVPLALDESLQDSEAMGALPALAGDGLVSALVLKPTVLGGLARCLSIASSARSLGLGVVVSHCFEGPVAYAAAVRLARLLPEPWPCGLAPHGGLGMRPVLEPQLCWSSR